VPTATRHTLGPAGGAESRSAPPRHIMNTNQHAGGPQTASDGCTGFVLLLVWAISCGFGVLLPEELGWAGAAYETVRSMSRKPILGVVMMASVTPVYLAICLLSSMIRGCWNTAAGKVLFTAGGWLIPDRADKEDECYTSIRQCAQTPVIGGPIAAFALPIYCVGKSAVLVASAIYWCVMATWEQPAGKVLFTAGGWLIPDRADKEDECYTSIRQCAQTPVIGGPIAAFALPIYCVGKSAVLVATAIYWCVMATWEQPAGKVLFTAGGWLVPQLDQVPGTLALMSPGDSTMVVAEKDLEQGLLGNVQQASTQIRDIERGAPAHTVGLHSVPAQSRRREDAVYQCVRSAGKTPLVGGPLALALVIPWGVGKLAWVIVSSMWATRIGRSVLTFGGALVPNRGESPDSKADSGRNGNRIDRLSDQCYSLIRTVGGVPVLGGPIALPLLMLWCLAVCIVAVWRCLLHTACVVWAHPFGKAIVTLGGSLVAQPSDVTTLGHPVYSKVVRMLGPLPVFGVTAVVTAVLYALGEILALLFKRPSIRGAWWSIVLATRRIVLASRVHCTYAMIVKLHRARANVWNYFAMRDIVWQQWETLGISYKLPGWILSNRPPAFGLEVYDPELFLANQDLQDVKWPCRLVCEAIDRAHAIVVVEMYKSAGRCLAPADCTMLASTSYDMTRGQLTFSGGTLSIGRLSATLVRAAKAQASKLELRLTQSNGQAEATLSAAEEGHACEGTSKSAEMVDGGLHRRPMHSVSTEQDAEQQQLARALHLLNDLRRRVSQLNAQAQVRQSPLMERRIDSILCSFLGQEGLDASRIGDRYQRAEAWVRLLTGLSSADLVRARRLRDSRSLATRADLLAVLRVIDEIAAQNEGDIDLVDAALEREQVWQRLADVGAVGQLPALRPAVMGVAATNAASDVTAAHGCYEYPQVVHAVPVWPGTTQDGQLPVLVVAY
jgi:hypothetical protein